MAAIKDRNQLQSLKEVINKDDDWSGMDSAARRKRQNRLNQRAYRRRKAQQFQVASAQVGNIQGTWEYQPFPPPNTPSSQASGTGSVLGQPHHPNWLTRAPILHYQSSPSSTTLSNQTPESSLVRAYSSSPHSPIIPYIDPTSPTPIPISGPITFPLTSDHLIPLIQYNVLRATLTNMSLLNILSQLPTDCGNALLIPLLPVPSSIPPSLEPTPLQKSTPHDIWIDMLPLGQMRDNVITLQGKFDHDDLCSDMVGGLFEGFNELENKGVLVWSDPWRAEGWEVTQGFARKWKMLLRGCGELIESTNRWRGLRGEEPLVVEV